MAIKSLEEVLRVIIGWEMKLKYLYNMLGNILKDERSKKVVQVLKDRLNRNLSVLEKIHPEDYRKVEFIKNLPDEHSESVLPPLEISSGATPEELLNALLSYEEKLGEFYSHVRDVVVFSKSKEVFDLLIQFKKGQIKEIKELLDSVDMAV